MNFAELNSVKIPEGNVDSISVNGNVIWTATKITWDEVLASVNAGTYATDFRIGDCVPLDLGSEGVIYMQIVAFDTDDLADGSGKAPITWIAKQLLNTKQRMNPQSVLNKGEIKEFPASINSNNNSRVEANVSTRTTFKGSIQPGEVAEITNTINPSEDGTLTITYKGMVSTYGSLEVLVNGETIVADYGSVHPATHTVELVSGTAVTVIVKYTSKDGMLRDAAYVEFKSTGSFDITTTCNTVQALDYSYTEGAGAVGGWEKSEFRAYLNDTIKNLIPETVRDSIKEVVKTQEAYDVNGNSFTQITIDDVWIPSESEVCDSDGLYSAIYNDKQNRKKLLNGVVNSWFFRNSADCEKVRGMFEDDGFAYSFYAYVSLGIALSFCTGAVNSNHDPEPEDPADPADKYTWDAVLASIDAGTYATDYTIGDMVPLDLGDEGLINMQIIAFDADDLADGSGKAPITWLSKELLATDRRMNPASVSNGDGTYQEGTGAIGGWEKTEMRAYLKNTIKPLLPEAVRNSVKEVTKTQTAFDTTGTMFTQTSIEDVWLLRYGDLFSNISPYMGVFNSSEDKKKSKVGATISSNWWLRNSTSTDGFCYVRHSGANYDSGADATVSYGVAFAFCT